MYDRFRDSARVAHVASREVGVLRRRRLSCAYAVTVVLVGVYAALMVIAGTDVLGVHPDHRPEWDPG